jgi:ubiquitin-protein ligase
MSNTVAHLRLNKEMSELLKPDTVGGSTVMVLPCAPSAVTAAVTTGDGARGYRPSTAASMALSSRQQPVTFASLSSSSLPPIASFLVTITPGTGPHAATTHTFSLQVPPSYPFKPPIVTCSSGLACECVDRGGRVAIGVLGEGWRPVMSVNSVILGLQLMLIEPDARRLSDDVDDSDGGGSVDNGDDGCDEMAESPVKVCASNNFGGRFRDAGGAFDGDSIDESGNLWDSSQNTLSQTTLSQDSNSGGMGLFDARGSGEGGGGMGMAAAAGAAMGSAMGSAMGGMPMAAAHGDRSAFAVGKRKYSLEDDVEGMNLMDDGDTVMGGFDLGVDGGGCHGGREKRIRHGYGA